jgi:hypothetical protein
MVAVISFAARREAVRCGASAGRPARWAGCPAALGVEAPPSNSLRARWALRSDSDGELVHEARCARGPRPLRSSATLRRAAAHHLPPRGTSKTFRYGPIPSPSRQRGPGRGAVGGGEKRSGRVSARSAHPGLIRRRCPSAAAQGREASSTARPGREHRSGVGHTADRSRRPHAQAPAVARRTPNTPNTPSTQRLQSPHSTTIRPRYPS